MRILFSTLFFIGTLGVILWWSFHSVPRALSPSETLKTNQNTALTPIETAENAKEALESKNPFSLDLSGQNLTKVPDTTFNQIELQSLNLSNNKLSGSLQAEIRHLENLKNLDLSNNNFTGVPAEIGQLKNLEVLNLSHNALTGLPYELGNLINLKVLDVHGNTYSGADLEIIRAKLSKDVTIIIE